MHTTDNYLGRTIDGYKVYDREDSHLHFEEGINKKLVEEALKRMYANGSKFKVKEVHFSKPIGYNYCVPITSEDDVVMVYRKGREGKTPMVKGRKPLPCNILTVIIRKERDKNNHYTLVTCFIGGGSKREPWDKGIRTDEERKESEEYWSSHALLYNPELIDWDRM